MKRYHFAFDRRVRICGQCHTWFLSEGAHSRMCDSCRAEAGRPAARFWDAEPSDVTNRDAVAMTAREPVAG